MGGCCETQKDTKCFSTLEAKRRNKKEISLEESANELEIKTGTTLCLELIYQLRSKMNSSNLSNDLVSKLSQTTKKAIALSTDYKFVAA